MTRSSPDHGHDNADREFSRSPSPKLSRMFAESIRESAINVIREAVAEDHRLPLQEFFDRTQDHRRLERLSPILHQGNFRSVLSTYWEFLNPKHNCWTIREYAWGDERKSRPEAKLLKKIERERKKQEKARQKAMAQAARQQRRSPPRQAAARKSPVQRRRSPRTKEIVDYTTTSAAIPQKQHSTLVNLANRFHGQTRMAHASQAPQMARPVQGWQSQMPVQTPFHNSAQLRQSDESFSNFFYPNQSLPVSTTHLPVYSPMYTPEHTPEHSPVYGSNTQYWPNLSSNNDCMGTYTQTTASPSSLSDSLGQLALEEYNKSATLFHQEDFVTSPIPLQVNPDGTTSALGFDGKPIDYDEILEAGIIYEYRHRHGQLS